LYPFNAKIVAAKPAIRFRRVSVLGICLIMAC
jgi:hypothetical protein